MNRTEFAQGLALLTGAVGKPMPDEQIAAWFALLNDLTAEQFKAGIVETLRTHQYAGFPPVGTVRTNALAGVAGAIAPKDRPLLAWLSVVESIARVSSHESVVFTDPVINATIRALGGWSHVRHTPADDRQWLEKQFREYYAAYSGIALRPEQTARLPGTGEMSRPVGNHPFVAARVSCLTAPGDQADDGPVIQKGYCRRPEKTEAPKLGWLAPVDGDTLT